MSVARHSAFLALVWSHSKKTSNNKLYAIHFILLEGEGLATRQLRWCRYHSVSVRFVGQRKLTDIANVQIANDNIGETETGTIIHGTANGFIFILGSEDHIVGEKESIGQFVTAKDTILRDCP